MITKMITQCLGTAFVILLSCGNANNSNDKSQASPSATTSAAASSRESSASAGGSDLVGDWKLSLECYDDNHNHQLDDAERKKGFSNHYFYRFSADKTCIISPFASNQLKSGFKGHYQLSEKNGKQVITTYWDEAEQKGQREAQYTVISVNKTELVMLETTGDHTFWIFTRIG